MFFVQHKFRSCRITVGLVLDKKLDASRWSHVTLHNYFVIKDENNGYAETSCMGPCVGKYIIFGYELGYEQYLFIGLNLQAKQQLVFNLSFKKMLNFYVNLCVVHVILKGWSTLNTYIHIWNFSDKIIIKYI